ncbi:MAG: hypothetical protein ABTQ32_09575 [Myxococcaceae bacterium]
MSLLLALLLTQAPDAPSTSSGKRTAALIAVGVGTPLVTAGVGALIGLPFTTSCTGSLCGIYLVLGALAGGAIGLVVMPFALLLTDHLLGTSSEGNAGLVIGGFVGLLLGLGAGAGLVAIGSLLGSSSAAGLTVSILGGVVALGLPITGAIIGKNLARAPSPGPTLTLVPLRGGAALSFSGTF